VTRNHFHLHLVSDTTEKTLAVASRAAATLYPGVSSIEHVHARVRTRDQLLRVVADIEREPGIVLHALIDPQMTAELEERCRAAGSPSLSMLKLSADGPAGGSSSPYRSLVNLHLRAKAKPVLRPSVAVFAVVLGILGFWILAADLLRPGTMPYFPSDAATAKVAAGFRERAGAAANVGLLRGELWTDYAAALLGATDRDGNAIMTPEAADAVHSAAEHAARLAPHDSRAWLLLAAAMWQGDRSDRRIPEALKMSYYTGSREAALMPLRLFIATHSGAAADPELQSLIGREIRIMATLSPELRSAIGAAYRGASPEGRHVIEATPGALASN
jgi:hypothetical protein